MPWARSRVPAPVPLIRRLILTLDHSFSLIHLFVLDFIVRVSGNVKSPQWRSGDRDINTLFKRATIHSSSNSKVSRNPLAESLRSRQVIQDNRNSSNNVLLDSNSLSLQDTLAQ